jgi:magnesium transporter
MKDLSQALGQPPGTPVHIGKPRAAEVQIEAIDYDESALREFRPKAVEECRSLRGTPTVTWINVTGLHDVRLIEQIGAVFDIHPLTLEDIVNTGQRPKFEDVEDYLFVVLKMLYIGEAEKEIIAEQVSLVLGEGFVLTFQEAPGDVFELIRQRIRNAKGRVRRMGADYLVYSLIDAVLDNYFVVLERFGEDIEQLQERVVTDTSMELLRQIHRFKRENTFLRKCAWPLREMISAFQHSESRLIRKPTAIYLRNLYDHAVQIIDTMELFRDTGAGMLETYLSSASNRMNEVMKVLAIIATIFIPLTLVAGIYGMNFEYMPETGWKGGYFTVLGVMLLLGMGMVYWFRRKKWI